MANLGQTYRNEDAPGNDVMPAGAYLAQVIESQVVATKAGNGTILRLTIEIMDGEFARRRIWEQLNIRNPNPQAQNIATRALAQLCDAVGLPAIEDSEDLHFKPMRITVAIEDKDDGFGAKNRVKKYAPVNAQTPAGKAAPTTNPSSARSTANGGSGSAQSAAAPQKSTGDRPWQRAQA